MASTAEILAQYSKPGDLFQKLEKNQVRCLACGHRCPIHEGKSGVCKVRFNREGVLQVPFGYVSGMQCDPIEKKPFFHVRPGSPALSFGMLGCNFHCGFCQNWITSQVLRDPKSVPYLSPATPGALIQAARREGAEIVVSTYNEPMISVEWSVAVFRQAKAAGLLTAYVSNGYATPEALEYLVPWVDLFKVDLKCFDDKQYRRLGGRLQPVLETIKGLYKAGTWIEIVTLLVPGFNDSTEDLSRLTKFISTVSPDIPWHVTAFHRNYRMTDSSDTTPEDLLHAVEIGRNNGLRYIYTGNLPGNTGDMENTRCPDCGELLVERIGYRVLGFNLTPEGECPSCKAVIPGRWASSK
ncbi:MAG: AmmeMemoRadiSam system radical SAM enzyme [Acidobacteria bacterium]|nr:AmmeMemoRadiSam system radical SAM enzyme [Acidobacteriota bacterium]